MTWPDLGELLAWLVTKLDTARAELESLRQTMAFCSGPCHGVRGEEYVAAALERVKAEARAEAFDEAADHCEHGVCEDIPDWLRDRAAKEKTDT